MSESRQSRAYGDLMEIRGRPSFGFKNPKYVISREVTNDWQDWEDQGHNSFSGN
jgi:hypothetical protein